MDMYDVIIVGGGSAGLTAGLYAGRRNLKTLLLTKEVGGQANLAPFVENYPGVFDISGIELMKNFKKQAIDAGVELKLEEVLKIEENKTNKTKTFVVKTEDNTYTSKSIILAFGKVPRRLNIPGEKEFSGKGVSYCATCDMPLFKDKIVAVVGGGNSALDAALYGSELAKKVYLIHRRDEFRGFESLVEKVKEKENINLVLDSVVKEIKGDSFVESIIVENLLENKKKEIAIDGIFIEIGYITKTDFIEGLVKLDERNQVITNNKCEAFYPKSDEVNSGIFAAGDLNDDPCNQIVTAAGEGAKAALQVYNYLLNANFEVTDRSYRR